MKISRISTNLIIAAIIFGSLVVYFEKFAVQIRVDGEIKYEIRKKEEAQKYFEKTGEKMPLFGTDYYESETNYADYLAISFLVLTLSSVISAIWLRKQA